MKPFGADEARAPSNSFADRTVRRITALLAMLICAFSWSSWGDAVDNPGLFARDGGIENGERGKHSLTLSSLAIQIEVSGAIARTTLTAQFSNPEGSVDEAEFALALPDGSVVTGYALDVNDRMIEGVLADLPKALEVYEDKVRAGIDPGIATVSRANVFTTRVYPVRPETGRTIRLQYVTPIHPDKGWTLPLSSRAPVGTFSVAVIAEKVKSLPNVALPFGREVRWQNSGSKRISRTTLKNTQLQGEIHLDPVLASQPVLLSEHPAGKRFFQLSMTRPAIQPGVSTGGRLRVYWDRSRSRASQPTKHELTLLEKYLDTVRPESVDVVSFNSAGARIAAGKSARETLAILRSTTYRGATSFAALAALKLPAATTCLMFSDGLATIDDRESFTPACRLIPITSAANADRGYLRRLARTSGGEVHLLAADNLQTVLRAISTSRTQVVSVRDQNGEPLPFAVVSGGDRRLLIVGEAPRSGQILVGTGSGNGVLTQRFDMPIDPVRRFEGEGALWAFGAVADLAAQDAKEQAVRSLSKRFSIASPAMAFLVLETPEDYVIAELSPPKRYPAADLQRYVALKREHDERAAAAQRDRINAVLERWNKHKEWWATRFEPMSAAELQSKKSSVSRVTGLAAANAMPRATQAEPFAADLSASGSPSIAELVVVTGSTIRGSAYDAAAPIDVLDDTPVTRIELEPWNPNRPYLAALNAAKPSDVDAVLILQEEAFGALPAFYLDTAEWFYRKGRTADSFELLLSALDLPAKNQETVLAVADRLLRYQEFDRAIWLFERTLDALNHLPQPRRALATALVKRFKAGRCKNARRDLVRAVQLLNEIIASPTATDYEGIDLIALMDANAILPMLENLGIRNTALDPRLVALLDVDLRVVIEWNTGDTDIDLWIDEPNGEQVIYSNPRSSAGGLLSNDMTAGYGPEEYLLRRAPAGKYRIRINAYARDRINPNGATIVTAHLVRDYGRRTQREEVIDLELKADESGERVVGEFEVTRK